MDIWRKLAEEKIEEAQEKGEFDALPGVGRPIDLSDYFNVPESRRIGYHVLKNAGVVPEEVRLRKEIAALKKERSHCKDKTQIKNLTRHIDEKQCVYELILSRFYGKRY